MRQVKIRGIWYEVLTFDMVNQRGTIKLPDGSAAIYRVEDVEDAQEQVWVESRGLGEEMVAIPLGSDDTQRLRFLFARIIGEINAGRPLTDYGAIAFDNMTPNQAVAWLNTQISKIIRACARLPIAEA